MGAFGIPLPQETPASTQAIPNLAPSPFAHFGARVAQPVILAPQPAAVFPLAPTVAHSHVIPADIQRIVALHRAALTPFDLRLANPATHTHAYGAHPLLPIHPGYDKPHSHAPFTQHPVIDMVSGAIVSEPQTDINQALALTPIPAPIAPIAPLTGTLAPIAPIAPFLPAIANPVVNPPKVVGVEQSAGQVVDTNVVAAPIPFARFPVAAPASVGAPIPFGFGAGFGARVAQPVVLAPQPAPVAAPIPAAPFGFGVRVAQPIVLAAQPAPFAPLPVPAPLPAFNFAPAPAVVQPVRVVDVEQTPGKVEVEVAAVPVVHPIHPIHPVHPVHHPVHPAHPIHHPVHHTAAHVVHHSTPGHYHVQSHGAPLHHGTHGAPLHHGTHHAPASVVHHAPITPVVHHAHAPLVHHAPSPAVHHAVHHPVHHAPHHAVHHAPHHAVHHAPHHAVHHSHAGYEHRAIAAPAESKTYSFKVVEAAVEDREAKAIDEVSANLEINAIEEIIEEAPEQELLDDLVAEEVVLEEAPEEEIILEEVVVEEDLEEAPSTEQSPIEE